MRRSSPVKGCGFAMHKKFGVESMRATIGSLPTAAYLEGLAPTGEANAALSSGYMLKFSRTGGAVPRFIRHIG
jgi:hypothetical protein